jgi:hypothetical protein
MCEKDMAFEIKANSYRKEDKGFVCSYRAIIWMLLLP